MTTNYYEKRRNTPRLPIVYTTPDILQKLDYLAEKYGSKKAAIEAAIIILHATEKTKEHAGDVLYDKETNGIKDAIKIFLSGDLPVQDKE